MPGHTPGPWTIDRGVRTSINAGKKHVALVNWYNSTDAETRVSGDEHEANAYLIAAAPELLTAVKVLLTANADGKNVQAYLDAVDRARAAVAKAEKSMTFDGGRKN